MAGLIVIDASVLIAFFKVGDPFHDRVVSAVTSAIRRGDRLRTNELTAAEYMVGAARDNAVGDADSDLSALGIERREFPRSLAPRLAQIRHEARVRLPGAAVLLTAIDSTERGTVAVSVATFDDRLRAGAATYGIGSAVPENGDDTPHE